MPTAPARSGGGAGGCAAVWLGCSGPCSSRRPCVAAALMRLAHRRPRRRTPAAPASRRRRRRRGRPPPDAGARPARRRACGCASPAGARAGAAAAIVAALKDGGIADVQVEALPFAVRDVAGRLLSRGRSGGGGGAGAAGGAAGHARRQARRSATTASCSTIRSRAARPLGRRLSRSRPMRAGADRAFADLGTTQACGVMAEKPTVLRTVRKRLAIRIGDVDAAAARLRAASWDAERDDVAEALAGGHAALVRGFGEVALGGGEQVGDQAAVDLGARARRFRRGWWRRSGETSAKPPVTTYSLRLGRRHHAHHARAAAWSGTARGSAWR